MIDCKNLVLCFTNTKILVQAKLKSVLPEKPLRGSITLPNASRIVLESANKNRTKVSM